jgi:hypothetical protein
MQDSELHYASRFGARETRLVNEIRNDLADRCTGQSPNFVPIHGDSQTKIRNDSYTSLCILRLYPRFTGFRAVYPELSGLNWHLESYCILLRILNLVF